ncbi:hypothetical protein [Streptacidiphilus sp. EB103A]|uniref:hypothetical protein n=1 Tax=Streptacidiphilus sp. EB103A TaxID=3156275 RepID=UPI0035135005
MNHPDDTPHDIEEIAAAPTQEGIPATADAAAWELTHWSPAEASIITTGHSYEYPLPDDSPDDADLDQLLEAAGDSLMNHLEATTDPCDLLLALLEAVPQQDPDE